MAEPAATVEITETTAPVTAGDTLTVTVAVERASDEAKADETDGEAAAAISLDLLDFDGEAVDTAEIELAPGETGTVDLDWTPAAAGSGDVTVESGDASATAAVTVEEAPAAFEVEITSADEYVPEEGTATLVVEVTNTGTLEGSEAIELSIDGERAEARTLSLAGGETETIEFTRRLKPEQGPELTMTVSTDADSADTTIGVVAGTVTPLRPIGSKSGMGIFGWLVLLGMAILLLPLLPLYALLKLLDVLFGGNGTTQ
jgi:hypothetical protein